MSKKKKIEQQEPVIDPRVKELFIWVIIAPHVMFFSIVSIFELWSLEILFVYIGMYLAMFYGLLIGAGSGLKRW